MMLAQFGKSKVIHGIKDRKLKVALCNMSADSRDKIFYSSVKDVTCKICLKKIQRENIQDNILDDIEIYDKPILIRYIKTPCGDFKLSEIVDILYSMSNGDSIRFLEKPVRNYLQNIGVAKYDGWTNSSMGAIDRNLAQKYAYALENLFK